MVVLSN
jgi:WD40 repeat protein